ncbi:hemoglobin [Cytophagales bacterium WSM2-2]|nr:hemoglobin [Cytophagales bacterium WSM2-2]
MDSKNYLTGRQVNLLKRSFRKLNAQRVAARFYDRLFELHPKLREMFPPDHSDLMTKMMSVLELVVFSFEDKGEDRYSLQNSVILPLRELGRRHDDLGLNLEHYELANRLLIDSIQFELKDRFSNEFRESWGTALAMLSHAMLDKSMDDHKPRQSLQETFQQFFQEFKKRMSNFS